MDTGTKCFKVNNIIYAAGTGLVNTHRTAVTLTEPVQPQLLSDALRKAQSRYPYFSVRLRRQGETYVLTPNDQPFVLSPSWATVTLGTPESNDHLFAFAYEGNRLCMDGSHYITDGNGLFPFLKTILYYYLTSLHPDAALDPSNFALAGDPVPEAEADDDPYPSQPLPAAPLGARKAPEQIFTLSDQPRGYENMDRWTSWRFRIPQKDLMAYVSSVDGSPATFISALVYRSIMDTHPENTLPLVCGMQHQFRKALGRPFSHLCHVNVVPIDYPVRLRDRDIERINTISRGALIIRADDDNDRQTVNAHIRTEKRIQSMPLPRKVDTMRSVVLDAIGKNTYEVSYTGRVPWSGLDRYITDVAPYLDLTLSGGITVEIFSVGDAFSVNIMQRNDDPRYTTRFAELLSQSGIHYTASSPESFRICGFRLPD